MEDIEREVIEVLVSLGDSILEREEESEKESSFLPVWGKRGRRSAINVPNSPPQHPRPVKRAKTLAGDSSPATPLSFPPSESDDKIHQARCKIPKKKSREELLEAIKELTETRDLLTRELEKVKAFHEKSKAYNEVLKAKKKEIEEPKPELCKSVAPETGINLELKLSQNTTPLLENKLAYDPHKQYQQFLSKVLHGLRQAKKKTAALPDLNVAADDVYVVQVSGDYIMARRAAAADARQRRMVTMKEKKLTLAPSKTTSKSC